MDLLIWGPYTTKIFLIGTLLRDPNSMCKTARNSRAPGLSPVSTVSSGETPGNPSAETLRSLNPYVIPSTKHEAQKGAGARESPYRAPYSGPMYLTAPREPQASKHSKILEP